MKISKNQKRLLQKGLTLIELTVVIVVLLSLVGVLFIGTRAWREGSNKATCIVNQRNFQQAVRSYANLNGLTQGTAVTDDDIIGAGFISGTASNSTTSTPASFDITCPLDGDAYAEGPDGAAVPGTGVLWKVCANASSDDHVPTSYDTW